MRNPIIALLGLCFFANTASAILPAKMAKDEVVREFVAFSKTNKNSWKAVVSQQQMSLSIAKNKEHYPKLNVKRLAYAKGVEFYGKTRFGEVVLNINGKPCQNAKVVNEFTATLYYRNKIWKGCAVRRVK